MGIRGLNLLNMRGSQVNMRGSQEWVRHPETSIRACIQWRKA